mmetsp:Transcript_25226/g.79556  ORF Transcript_25226/g.79556 Transcript_25226/m.79556 type:complete len:209 (-) Transcript_25226:463-1089(-)
MLQARCVSLTFSHMSASPLVSPSCLRSWRPSLATCSASLACVSWSSWLRCAMKSGRLTPASPCTSPSCLKRLCSPSTICSASPGSSHWMKDLTTRSSDSRTPFVLPSSRHSARASLAGFRALEGSFLERWHCAMMVSVLASPFLSPTFLYSASASLPAAMVSRASLLIRACRSAKQASALTDSSESRFESARPWFAAISASLLASARR